MCTCVDVMPGSCTDCITVLRMEHGDQMLKPYSLANLVWSDGDIPGSIRRHLTDDSDARADLYPDRHISCAKVGGISFLIHPD